MKPKYYQCLNCNFMFVENPTWLQESYNSAINIEDTGILSRNLFYSKKLRFLLLVLFSKKAKFLDYGVVVMEFLQS